LNTEADVSADDNRGRVDDLLQDVVVFDLGQVADDDPAKPDQECREE